MKTILITSFHSYVSRNILRTGLLPELVASGTRVVLAVPDYKEDFFRKHFESAEVHIVPLKTGRGSRTRLGLLFKRFAELSYVSETTVVKRKYKYYHEHRFLYFLSAYFIETLGRFESVRIILRYLDQLLRPRNVMDAAFSFGPSLVFATDMFNENDILLMQEARSRGVKTVGMVRSWDNTSKYAMRFRPDYIVLGSVTLVSELERFHKYPSKDVIVTGYPHYDRYLAPPMQDRDTFLRSLGFDPQMKVIFFSPVGDDLIHHNDFDEQIMHQLAKRREQVLVRFPPASAVSVDAQFKPPPHMHMDIPGVAFNSSVFTDREITKEEDEKLSLSLRYSDVVVTGPTSIPLDAAFFDKPIIVADFYPTERHPFDGIYEYEYYHYKKMEEEAGGIWHVHSPNELNDAINTYLEDPNMHVAGRAQIRDRWFSHNTDGRASRRLAKTLLRHI